MQTKFCTSFRSVMAAGGVKTLLLPARSPNLNAFAERCDRRQLFLRIDDNYFSALTHHFLYLFTGVRCL